MIELQTKTIEVLKSVIVVETMLLAFVVALLVVIVVWPERLTGFQAWIERTAYKEPK
jgi:hypothetical protein